MTNLTPATLQWLETLRITGPEVARTSIIHAFPDHAGTLWPVVDGTAGSYFLTRGQILAAVSAKGISVTERKLIG